MRNEIHLSCVPTAFIVDCIFDVFIDALMLDMWAFLANVQKYYYYALSLSNSAWREPRNTIGGVRNGTQRTILFERPTQSAGI